MTLATLGKARKMIHGAVCSPFPCCGQSFRLLGDDDGNGNFLLRTSDQSPEIFVAAPEAGWTATSITIDGATYALTPAGGLNFAANVPGPLAGGVYPVAITGTDADGEPATGSGTLTIELGVAFLLRNGSGFLRRDGAGFLLRRQG